MYSTKGRPRQVTDTQVEAILEWHRNRKSLKAFAAEIGLSASTVRYVLDRKGQYKQPSPEKRHDVVMERLQRRKRLHAAGWL